MRVYAEDTKAVLEKVPSVNLAERDFEARIRNQLELIKNRIRECVTEVVKKNGNRCISEMLGLEILTYGFSFDDENEKKRRYQLQPGEYVAIPQEWGEYSIVDHDYSYRKSYLFNTIKIISPPKFGIVRKIKGSFQIAPITRFFLKRLKQLAQEEGIKLSNFWIAVDHQNIAIDDFNSIFSYIYMPSNNPRIYCTYAFNF